MTGTLLVCGSRDWPKDALWFVTQQMITYRPPGARIMTGGARGVDTHAHSEAVRLRWPTVIMHAQWERDGKRAGLLRNERMLDTGPDLVLAFHAGNSPGTAHTIAEAQRRGIPVRVFTPADLRGDPYLNDYDYEPISPG